MTSTPLNAPHPPPSSPALLSVQNVSKRFELTGSSPLEVLSDVSLELAQGQSLALSGRSGSGKSTLTHLIAGTEGPSEGALLWRGEPLHTLSESARAAWRLRELGLVFQDFRLFPHLSALENAALPLELLGWSAQEAEAKVRPLLEEVGLGGRLTHTPGELSGGEQQRVAIVRALAHEPAMIIADEPTGNLDWRSAALIADLLFALPKERGVALLLVTHDLALAERSDQHLQLTRGRLSLADRLEQKEGREREGGEA